MGIWLSIIFISIAFLLIANLSFRISDMGDRIAVMEITLREMQKNRQPKASATNDASPPDLNEIRNGDWEGHKFGDMS